MNKKDITLKELLERIVVLETKFDMAVEKHDLVTRRYTKYVALLISLDVTTILLIITLLSK